MTPQFLPDWLIITKLSTWTSPINERIISYKSNIRNLLKIEILSDCFKKAIMVSNVLIFLKKYD
jgi:hypothetical protein